MFLKCIYLALELAVYHQFFSRRFLVNSIEHISYFETHNIKIFNHSNSKTTQHVFNLFNVWSFLSSLISLGKDFIFVL